MKNNKPVLITITQETIDKAKKQSLETLGKVNVSGWISYLINNHKKNKK